VSHPIRPDDRVRTDGPVGTDGPVRADGAGPQPTGGHPPGRLVSRPRAAARSAPALLAALQDLVAAPEPPVALSALAGATVPVFADECLITFVDGPFVDRPEPHRITRPETAAPDPVPAGHVLAAPFQDRAYGVRPAYAGTVTYRWTDRRPYPVDAVIARLLVDRTVDLIRTARLAEALAAERQRADNLEVALESNREIGQALGILMYTHKLTSQQAFNLLRRASQDTNRKVRDIAAEICDTGMLADRNARGPAGHRRGQDSST
jgi:ANTAR domain